MTLTQEQLEWIVSEVVRRLRAEVPVTAPTAAAAPSRVRIGERLVTLETLRGRLDGAAEVEVGSKAVVTPAVVDHLKEKQIRLTRA